MSSHLTQVLSAMMPVPEQTLLLRASLLSGDAGRNAWNQWKAIAGDPKQAMADDRWAVKRLLPALYVSLRDNEADVDPALMPYLKLAYVREQMRSRTYFRICGEVLGALSKASIPFAMLRGGALAATTYPDPAVRHCHDIALLIRDEDVARANDAILATGRTTIPWNPADGGPAAILKDETTLPIELHTRLLNTPYYNFTWEHVAPRFTVTDIAGVATNVLSAEDALQHVCVHASYSEARWSMRWVADAWHLIHRNEIDWTGLMSIAARTNAQLPMFVALKYLAESLEANVPPEVLRMLERMADDVPAVARDIALRGARAGDNMSLSVLFDRLPPGLSLRISAARWLLFPSRQYVRDVIGVEGIGGTVAHYTSRPVNYVRQMMSGR